MLNLNLEAIEDTIRGAQPFRDSHACRHVVEAIAPSLLARVKQLTLEVERLREGLEEIIGEPWLMGGQDACTIASDALAGPSHAKGGDQLSDIRKLRNLELYDNGSWRDLKPAETTTTYFVQPEAGSPGRGMLVRADGHGNHVMGRVRWDQ